MASYSKATQISSRLLRDALNTINLGDWRVSPRTNQPQNMLNNFKRASTMALPSKRINVVPAGTRLMHPIKQTWRILRIFF